jgi:hypothetical protein
MTMPGERRMLELFVRQELTLRLFTNDARPNRGDTGADLVELRGRFGYKPITLDIGQWTIVEGAEEEIPSYAVYPKQIFEFNTVPVDELYGYFIQQADEIVLWIEQFSDGPYKIKTAGSLVRIQPRIELLPLLNAEAKSS